MLWYGFGVGFFIFLFVFLVTCSWIGYGVKRECESARNEYGGECVDALMNRVADEQNQYGKNSAIWALGQLGDKKALPFLEKYNTGEAIPEREKWNEGVSQYELRKAIKLLNGGFNISAWVWR